MIEQIFTIVLTIVIGLCVGSFLNVVIYRIPNDMSLVKPASHCPNCNHEIKWYMNIPVFSYIFLRGRCHYCKARISPIYPMVEILNMALWFVSLLVFTPYVTTAFTQVTNWYAFITSCIACSALICIFFIDLKHMEIPDVLQLVLLLCGLVSLLDNPTWENIALKVFGFIGGGLLFYIVNLCYKLVRKKDGIGFGDIELSACMGLLLGGYKLIYALLLSCVVGGLILVIIHLVTKGKGRVYPFAVLLAPGFVIALFTGEFVVNAYLSLLGGH